MSTIIDGSDEDVGTRRYWQTPPDIIGPASIRPEDWAEWFCSDIGAGKVLNREYAFKWFASALARGREEGARQERLRRQVEYAALMAKLPQPNPLAILGDYEGQV